MSDVDPYLQARMEAIMRPPWAQNLDRETEPKLVGDGPDGKADDTGRGDLSPRQQARLEALRGFWLRGYCD